MSDTQDAAGFPGLSDREKSVLHYAAQGCLDKEIAAHLGVTLATVRTYWDRIRHKLSAANRAHAVSIDLQHRSADRVENEMAAFVLRRIEDAAIFACGDAGQLLTWNQGVEELFGYSESEWVGQNSDIFFINEEKAEAKIEFDDAFRDGASVNDRWHVRKDGSLFWGTNTVIRFDPPLGEAVYSKIVRTKPVPDGELPPADQGSI